MGTQVIDFNNVETVVFNGQEVDTLMFNGIEIWAGFKKLSQLIDRSIESVTAEDLEGVESIGERAFNSCNKLTSANLPNSITTIGDLAFNFCESLTDVTIPNGVTTIGKSAFSGCSLSNVTLPVNLTTLGASAFYGNPLTSIVIPEGVTAINSGTFRRTLITEITIPSKVTTMDIGAFIDGTVGYENPLKVLKMLPTTPPTLTNDGFEKFPTSVTIQVPSASLSAYQSADKWANYSTQMVGGIV